MVSGRVNPSNISINCWSI